MKVWTFDAKKKKKTLKLYNKFYCIYDLLLVFLIQNLSKLNDRFLLDLSVRDGVCCLLAATFYVQLGEESFLFSLSLLRMVTLNLLDIGTVHLEVLYFFPFALLVVSLVWVLFLWIFAQGVTHVVLLGVTLCFEEGDHIGFEFLHSG